MPTPTTSDIGKAVQVVSDGSGGAEYTLDTIPNELPTPTTSDIGKVVKIVSDGGSGAEYSIGYPEQLLDNNSPYIFLQLQGTTIRNLNLYGKTRTEIYDFLATSYIVRPNSLVIDGFSSTWQYHYHGQTSLYCIDDFNYYLVFKAELIMNDPNGTVNEVTFKLHRTDSTKDILVINTI